MRLQEPKNNGIKVTFRILASLMRFFCEFGTPVFLFFIIPFVWASVFLGVFIAWQLYSYFVLAATLQDYTEELEKTKTHIRSVVRRYEDVTDAKFLFSFIRFWDKSLNPEYYNENENLY